MNADVVGGIGELTSTPIKNSLSVNHWLDLLIIIIYRFNNSKLGINKPGLPQYKDIHEAEISASKPHSIFISLVCNHSGDAIFLQKWTRFGAAYYHKCYSPFRDFPDLSQTAGFGNVSQILLRISLLPWILNIPPIREFWQKFVRHTPVWPEGFRSKVAFFSGLTHVTTLE